MAFSAGACISRQQVREETDGSVVINMSETATPAPIPPTEAIQPTAAQEDSSEPSAKRYSFDQLGISLEVPAELYVRKDPSVSYDDPGKLEGYQIYIQNYGYPGASGSGDFQMYGQLQYNLPPTTWEVFADITLNSPMNAYATEIEINGLRGFDSQLSGVRNRFVYRFLIKGQVLSLAVSAATEENKELADQIVSTLLYDPEKFTDASKVQKIIEPGFYYQMYIPEDWNYSFESTGGIRLSDLQASSADAEMVIEETDGPHSNIYYKNGIFMNLVILDDDSALSEPAMAVVKSIDQVMYFGIEMTDYVFVEPSTVEGELRELRFYHNGLSYMLRFGYPLDTDRDQIDWLLRNLLIKE